MTSKPTNQWLQEITNYQQEANRRINHLARNGITVKPEDANVIGTLPFIATFPFQERNTIVTIRFLLKDWQAPSSDIVITNITTNPEQHRSRGFGNAALTVLLSWAKDQNFQEIRATQVSDTRSIEFWQQNGFTPCPPPNPCQDFIRKL